MHLKLVLLLNDVILSKKTHIRRHNIIKEELQYQLSSIDFVLVSSLSLVSNDNVVRENDKIHRRKLQKLIPNIHDTSITDYVLHDHHKVIYK